MHSRRMTRLTNAFSKKAQNHAHAMALHFLYYNFVRVHKTLRMSPAMAAGITKRLWEMADVVNMLEAWGSGAGAPVPYLMSAASNQVFIASPFAVGTTIVSYTPESTLPHALLNSSIVCSDGGGYCSSVPSTTRSNSSCLSIDFTSLESTACMLPLSAPTESERLARVPVVSRS